VAFIQYTNRFFLPIRDLGAKYTVMQSAMASAERIFALLDRPPVIVSPAIVARTHDRASVDGASPGDGATGDPAATDAASVDPTPGAAPISIRPPTERAGLADPATINKTPAAN